MSAEPKRHVCEAWMVRRRPEGGRYCAVCGTDKS